MNTLATPASRQGLSLTVAIVLHAAALFWLTLLPAPKAPGGETPSERVIVARLLSELAPAPVTPVQEPAPAAPAAAAPHTPQRPPVKPAPAMAAVPLSPAPSAIAPAKPAAAATPAIAAAPSAERSGGSGTTETAASSARAPAAAPAGEAELPARPDYAYNPKPDYPPLARQFGLTGQVLVRVFVESSGAPREVQLANSSGHDMLDQAALRSVKGWRFLPAKHSGQAYASWVEFKVRFDLTN